MQVNRRQFVERQTETRGRLISTSLCKIMLTLYVISLNSLSAEMINTWALMLSIMENKYPGSYARVHKKCEGAESILAVNTHDPP